MFWMRTLLFFLSHHSRCASVKRGQDRACDLQLQANAPYYYYYSRALWANIILCPHHPSVCHSSESRGYLRPISLLLGPCKQRCEVCEFPPTQTESHEKISHLRFNKDPGAGCHHVKPGLLQLFVAGDTWITTMQAAASSKLCTPLDHQDPSTWPHPPCLWVSTGSQSVPGSSTKYSFWHLRSSTTLLRVTLTTSWCHTVQQELYDLVINIFWQCPKPNWLAMGIEVARKLLLCYGTRYHLIWGLV